jgi:hypothetical protein
MRFVIPSATFGDAVKYVSFSGFPEFPVLILNLQNMFVTRQGQGTCRSIESSPTLVSYYFCDWKITYVSLMPQIHFFRDPLIGDTVPIAIVHRAICARNTHPQIDLVPFSNGSSTDFFLPSFNSIGELPTALTSPTIKPISRHA